MNNQNIPPPVNPTENKSTSEIKDSPSLRSNINDNFFAGTYQKVWRKIIPPGLTEAESAFIEDAAQLATGDRVLDLLCGYGRHALSLGRAGYAVTAVDNAREYIAEIKHQASAEKLPVEAIEAGILTFPFEHQYKAAICMGNSFAFFNKNDAAGLLKKISAHLLSGGVFIINSWMVAEIAIRHFKEREWHDMQDMKYLTHYQFHFSPSRIESEHTIISSNGTIETIQGVDYIFTLMELETMFNEAGLKTVGVFSTPKKRPFKLGDATIYIVAQKAM